MKLSTLLGGKLNLPRIAMGAASMGEWEGWELHVDPECGLTPATKVTALELVEEHELSSIGPCPECIDYAYTKVGDLVDQLDDLCRARTSGIDQVNTITDLGELAYERWAVTGCFGSTIKKTLETALVEHLDTTLARVMDEPDLKARLSTDRSPVRPTLLAAINMDMWDTHSLGWATLGKMINPTTGVADVPEKTLVDLMRRAQMRGHVKVTCLTEWKGVDISEALALYDPWNGIDWKTALELGERL